MYISLHTHDEHSNYRLRDSTNRIKNLFEYTHQLGHKGIAITDHETVGSALDAIEALESFRLKDPDGWKDYKVILGNEIYLCPRPKDPDEHPKIFPHFILLAKDAVGHYQLRKLSTKAWVENSFMSVMMRVPTYYDDLFAELNFNRGHLIGSTACLGGVLSQNILKAYKDFKENPNGSSPDYSLCVKWISKMKLAFGKGNFFLEMQPSKNEEQIIVNKVMLLLSEMTDTPYVITTDAHYLKKEDYAVQEAFLNAQEGEREVMSFYASTYIMSENEIHGYMDESLGVEAVQKGIDNTMLVYDMCEEYDIRKPLEIPYIPDNVEEPSKMLFNKYKAVIPDLEYFYRSGDSANRHLVREILEAIEKRPEEFKNQKCYDSIQTCLESIKLSSEKMNCCWSAYLLQTRGFIDICWASNSLAGPARGSGAGFFLLYLLGIIQINPAREKAPTAHWRFLNPERVSPLDIDMDCEGNKRSAIIENIQKKYGGYEHVTRVQTILREKSKSALQSAARGLGIDNDIGTYLSSFVKAERGIQYTLKQMYYGDEENGIVPDVEFVGLMDGEYKELWNVATKIEGLITGVGSHAGGVILSKPELTTSTALMRTNSGDVITQFDLHASEKMGLIKWDLLGIDALQKMHYCLDLLIEDGLIEDQGSLKATYEKYLGVYAMDRDSNQLWDLICSHKILSLFQFEKQSGIQAIDIGQPRNLEEMAALNSVMRLMAIEGSEETPLQRYGRFKANIELWYTEMRVWGLTENEIELVKKYALRNYGLLPNQEDFMLIVQDPALGGASLLWADRLRKSIAKLFGVSNRNI